MIIMAKLILEIISTFMIYSTMQILMEASNTDVSLNFDELFRKIFIDQEHYGGVH